MAYNVKVGTILNPTSVQTASYSGFGFQPKAIIFFANNAFTDDTENTSSVFMVGIATGSGIGNNSGNNGDRNTAQCCMVGGNTDGLSTTDANKYQDSNRAIRLTTTVATAPVLIQGNVSSFDADGFSVNWSDVETTQFRFNYLALGGSDLTNVALVEVTTSADTSTDYGSTRVGFQPDALFVISNGSATAPPAATTIQRLSLGFATASNDSGSSIGWFSNDNSATGGNNSTMAYTASIVSYPVSTTLQHRAYLRTYNADGFSIRQTSQPASGRYEYVLCLKGGTYGKKLVLLDGTSPFSVTTLGYKPQALFAVTKQTNTYNNIQTTTKVSIGATDGTTTQQVSITDTNTENPTVAKTYWNNGALLQWYYNDSIDGVVVGNTMAFSSFDTNGFTFTNTGFEPHYVEFWCFGMTVDTPAAVSFNEFSMLMTGD